MIDEAVEKFAKQIDIEVTNMRAGKRNVHMKSWTTRQINHRARQWLIEWRIKMPVTTDAFFIAQCFIERLSKRDTRIFNTVVIIDKGIASTFDI